MKLIVLMAVILVLFFLCGMNSANAEQMAPCGCAMMQGTPVKSSDATGSEDPQHHRGMMNQMGMIERMMPEHMMEVRHHILRMLMGLGLDEKQKEAIHRLINKTMKDMITKRTNLLLAEMELEDAFYKDTADLDVVESRLTQMATMKTDMFMTHLKAFQEVKSMLTPEQKDKLREMMESHMTGGMGMMKSSDCGKMDGKKVPKDDGMMMK